MELWTNVNTSFTFEQAVAFEPSVLGECSDLNRAHKQLVNLSSSPFGTSAFFWPWCRPLILLKKMCDY
jgi:hypothetical protein